MSLKYSVDESVHLVEIKRFRVGEYRGFVAATLWRWHAETSTRYVTRITT